MNNTVIATSTTAAKYQLDTSKRNMVGKPKNLERNSFWSLVSISVHLKTLSENKNAKITLENHLLSLSVLHYFY